jgi:hypothetical protein
VPTEMATTKMKPLKTLNEIFIVNGRERSLIRLRELKMLFDIMNK